MCDFARSLEEQLDPFLISSRDCLEDVERNEFECESDDDMEDELKNEELRKTLHLEVEDDYMGDFRFLEKSLTINPNISFSQRHFTPVSIGSVRKLQTPPTGVESFLEVLRQERLPELRSSDQCTSSPTTPMIDGGIEIDHNDFFGSALSVERSSLSPTLMKDLMITDINLRKPLFSGSDDISTVSFYLILQ